jgi:outer membrane protein assembly factor BamB
MRKLQNKIKITVCLVQSILLSLMLLSVACSNSDLPSKAVWSVNFSDPDIYQNIYYFNKNIYCLTFSDYSKGKGTFFRIESASGNILWKKDFQFSPEIKIGGIFTSFGVSDDLIIYHKSSEVTQAIDANNGNELWSSTIIKNVLGYSSGKVFVVNNDDLLTVLNKNTGEILSTSKISVQLPNKLLINGKTAYFLNGTNLSSLNLETFETLWQYKSVENDKKLADILYGYGNVYSADGTNLLAFDAKTGKLKWTYPFRGSLPFLSGEFIYLGSNEKQSETGKVTKLEAENGKEIYTKIFPVKFGSDLKVIANKGKIVQKEIEPHYSFFSRKLLNYFYNEDKLNSSDVWIKIINEDTGEVTLESPKYWGVNGEIIFTLDDKIILPFSNINWSRSSQITAFPLGK